MRRSTLLQILVLGIAVAACAWFVLGALQTHDTTRAASILSDNNRLSRSQARDVSSLLDGAGFLNPDRQVDILRGQLSAQQAHEARARSIFLGVVRAEPRNIVAWDLLAKLGYGPAFAKIAALEPPVR